MFSDMIVIHYDRKYSAFDQKKPESLDKTNIDKFSGGGQIQSVNIEQSF